ncbi:MAG: hypothetical protein FJX76_10860 [Armatimonadetes bacterium]|nr:hypothetical protein [Armatimonadota bacterium]
MEVDRALAQIAEIHRHLDRTECYRGYRSATMALTAAVAVAGALLQPKLLGVHPTPVGFAAFWLVLAAVNVALVAGEIAADITLLSPRLQRLTWRVVSQFLPCLAAGALIPVAFAQTSVELLPGTWAALFSLGVFASRPYLPHGVGWVGLYYLMASAGLFALGAGALHPWAMGTCFAIGQTYLAGVLYWNLERGTGDVV